jgi:hypothetical protein
MTAAFSGDGLDAWWTALSLLHLLGVLLLLAVLGAWSRHERRWRLTAPAAALAALVSIVFASRFQPHDIPIDWITIIHEGQGHQSIRHLYAAGVHAGVNAAFVTHAVAAGPFATLRDVVWLNMLLGLVNAVLFFHLALGVTHIGWALVWTVMFALNPATFMGSFSEIPSNLLSLYFLTGVLAWLTLNDTRPQPAGVRAAAFSLCVVLSALTFLTRPEVALIGVVALSLYSLHAAIGDHGWRELTQRLRDASVPVLAALAQRPALVLALSALGFYFSWAGLPWELLGRSETSALYPFNPSFFSLFFFLPMLLLPIGATVGVAFGFIYSLRHFASFGGLALSLFVLVRLYFAGQDQYFETGRYLSHVFAAVFLLGLFAKQQLDELGRRWTPTWYRLALVVYLMLWTTRPLPGTPDFYLRPDYPPGAGFSHVFLDLNTQREVRHLLEVTEREPRCVFIGRVVESYARPDRPLEYAYAVFGVGVPKPIFASEKSTTLAEVVERHAAGAECVRLYYGGDCNLVHTDRCTQFVAGRKVLDEDRFWSRLYNNPHDYGYAETEVVLATYAWP